jgi:hypothetical protein
MHYLTLENDKVRQKQEGMGNFDRVWREIVILALHNMEKMGL